MNCITYLLLFFLVACSSQTKKDPTSNVEAITNENFKKEKPLSSSQVSDFYSLPSVPTSGALQEETLDRLSGPDLQKLPATQDPLIGISTYCGQGRFQEGFSLASKNLDKYQKIPAFWNLVANCHLNQGNHRKALLFYNKAFELDQNYVPALNNIGVLYQRQGQDQKALVAFERAHRSSKFSKTPRYNLAKLYLKYGLVEQALPILNGLLESVPEDLELRDAVGSAYFMAGDYRLAVSHFQRLPPSVISRPEVGLNFTMSLLKLGQIDAAKKVMAMISKPKGQEMKSYYAQVASQLGGKQ
jgi:tetratricopeptide (TPR) repeat protein